MNRKTGKWLSVSVFVSKKKWHLLMGSLKVFLEGICDNDSLLLYKIVFGYQPVESIKLALYVPARKAHIVSGLTDIYLKDFFLTNKLLPTENKIKDTTIFMPYLNNTAQYGLHTCFLAKDPKSTSELEHSFSTLLLNAFGDESIDDEAIITFAVYILFANYSLLKKADPAISNSWKKYYQHIIAELVTDEFNHELIEEQYGLLEETLDQIYSNIENGLILNEIPWIGLWEKVLKSALINTGRCKNASLLFAQVNNLIIQQLSLNISSQILINSFVLKTLEKSEQN